MKKNETEIRVTTLDAEVHKKIKELSKKNKRTMQREVERLLECHPELIN